MLFKTKAWRVLAGITLSLSALPAAQAVDYQTRALFSAEVSKKICSDGGAWFEKCYGIKASTCIETASGFVTPCVDKAISDVQQPLEHTAGMELAKKMVKCFNESFLTFYSSRKSSDSACNTPPPHLSN
jgi:hypothetical protein